MRVPLPPSSSLVWEFLSLCDIACLVPVLLLQSIFSSNRRAVLPYLIPHWFPVSPTFLFLLSDCPLLPLMCLRCTLPKEIVSYMYVSSYILYWIFGFSSLVQTLLSIYCWHPKILHSALLCSGHASSSFFLISHLISSCILFPLNDDVNKDYFSLWKILKRNIEELMHAISETQKLSSNSSQTQSWQRTL